MLVSKDQARKLLREHGKSLIDPTATNYNGEWIDGTDFLSEMGDRQDYELEKVLAWLGY